MPSTIDDIILGGEKGSAIRIGFLPPAIKEYAWPEAKIREKFKYDPEQAKKLLAEAGYSLTNPVQINSMGSTQFYMQSAEVAQKQLEAVGIKVKITDYTATPFESQAKGDWDVYFGALGASMIPGFHMYDLVRTGGFRNYGKFNNAKVDALADAQAREIDPAKRKQIIDQMQDLLFDQMPYVPVYDKIANLFYSCRVKNMKPHIPEPDLEGLQEAWIDPTGC